MSAGNDAAIVQMERNTPENVRCVAIGQRGINGVQIGKDLDVRELIISRCLSEACSGLIQFKFQHKAAVDEMNGYPPLLIQRSKRGGANESSFLC